MVSTPGPGRIVLAGGSTAVVVALLFGHHTAPAVAPGVRALATGAAGTTGTSGGAGGGSGASGKAVAGDVAHTRWGPVQVQITVSGGKVVGATVLQVPNGNMRDQEINSYAVPILNSETVKAGSASIDTVSGATVTSDGYISSLQSALDRGGL